MQIGFWIHHTIYDRLILYQKIRFRAAGISRFHKTLLNLDLRLFVGIPHYCERIMPRIPCVLKVYSDSETIRLSTTAPSHFGESMSVMEGLF